MSFVLSLSSVAMMMANMVSGQTGYVGHYHLDRQMEAISSEYGNAGCSISVIKNGEVMYNVGTGEIDIDGDNKIFRVASLSKNVAATALGLALGEDVNGYGLTVDSTIAEVLAHDTTGKAAIFYQFSTIDAYKDVITIKQLASMGSGFRHYESLHEYLWAPDLDDTRSILEQYLSLFGDDPLFCEPGTCYKYSSFGYYILTELIEVISGMDFYDFQEQKIYAALGLTGMGDRDTLGVDLFANSYLRVCDQDDRGYKFTADCWLNDTLSDIEFDKIVYYKKGAGNVLSTTLDYARYIDTVVWNRNDFLPTDFHYEMHHGQTMVRSTDYYGYGWHISDGTDSPARYWHTGGAVGGITVVRVQMESALVTTAFCDIQTGSAGPYAMIAAAEAYFGPDTPPATTVTISSETGYVGYPHFDRYMEAISAKYGNAGCSISCMRSGELVYNYGTGEIDINADNKIFRVASLSKNVAATALGLALGEDANGYGLSMESTIADVLAYDADKLAIFNKFSTISAYLDIITIKQLASMNSGFRHYETLHEYLWAPDLDDTRSILEQYLSLFGDDDLTCEPGTCYKYSSFGYYILTELIEVISGMDFYEYQRVNIYDALGLSRMGDRESLNVDLFANSYLRACEQLDRDYKFTADCTLNDTLSELEFDKIVYYKKGAGNVLSTTLDYVRYTDTIVWNRNDFLPADFHYEMHHGQTMVRSTDYYGYGWHISDDTDSPAVYWHTGGAVGGITVVRVQMETEIVTAAFCDIQTGSAGPYEMIAAAEAYFGTDNFTLPATTMEESTSATPTETEATEETEGPEKSSAVQCGAGVVGLVLAVFVYALF